MQPVLKVLVVATWVLVLLCGGTVNSDESCANSATKTTGPTCSTISASSPLATAAKSATASATSATSAPVTSGHSDSEGTSTAQDTAAEDEEMTQPAVEAKPVHCPDIPTGENFTSVTAKLHGSWRVVAGYVRRFTTKAFCPILTLCVDPADSNNVTVSWIKAQPFENVVPRGKMTMGADGILVDDDGFHNIEVIKLDVFLALRVWNQTFRRALILSPVSDPDKKDAPGNVFDFIMSIHADVHQRDGPAWYICAAAYYSVPSSGDGR